MDSAPQRIGFSHSRFIHRADPFHAIERLTGALAHDIRINSLQLRQIKNRNGCSTKTEPRHAKESLNEYGPTTEARKVCVVV
jgi:hypothetical protein